MIMTGSFHPNLLDKCVSGNLMNEDKTKLWIVTPKVAESLPNCTFKFCARIAEPYVNGECKSGLEVDIIEVLQEKFKFKV